MEEIKYPAIFANHLPKVWEKTQRMPQKKRMFLPFSTNCLLQKYNFFFQSELLLLKDPAALLKEDSSTYALLCFLRKFKEQLFRNTPCKTHKSNFLKFSLTGLFPIFCQKLPASILLQ